MKNKKTNFPFTLLISTFLIFFSFSFLYAQKHIIHEIDKFGNKLQVQLNDKTGSAHRIYGLNLNADMYVNKITANNIPILSQKLFDDYKSILKVDPAELKLIKAENGGGMWFVSYKQEYKSIPVYGTEIGYTIDKNGNIVLMGADAYQNIKVSTIPSISENDAITISLKAFGTYSAKNISKNQLIILPKSDSSNTKFYLTYEIRLNSLKPIKDSVYFVDAISGNIIERYSNIHDWNIHGTIIGTYYPQHYYDATLNSSYSTINIIIYDALGQKVTQGNSDNNGYYSINSSAAYAVYYLSIPLENSWVQVHDGSNKLITYTYSFTPNTSIQFDYNWSAGDASNVRYHTSIIHDYYKNNFGYNSMDYQMTASIDQGSSVNGASDGTNIDFGSQNGQYWARSSDVIYHEYTHDVIYHIYGGWIGDPNNGVLQGSAMDEGLSDYFACTINNDPIQGEDVGVNRDLNNNDVYPTNYDFSSGADPHKNGLIISGAVWDLRQSVGNIIGDNLTFRALQVSPHAHDFSDFETNAIVADNNYYSGSYNSQIQTAFSNHGISIPTLIASISGPTSLSIGQNGTWNASVSGGVPNYNYQWYYEYPGNTAASTTVQPYLPPVNAWYTIGTNSPTLTTSFSANVNLKCVITDATNNSVTSNILSVTVGAAKISAGQYSISKTPVPEFYSMRQNYPNPFNPSTIIHYEIPKDGLVTLKVFDVLGREVKTLVNEFKSQGNYSVSFDASQLASGVYFYQLKSGDFVSIKKMILMK
ncbi:MAG: T9SS type A sorting domain-containing protein [Ignavibacteriaceae bacterium]